MAIIKPIHGHWTILDTMYVDKNNIIHKMKICESLVANKHGDIFLPNHFVRM